MGGGDQFLFWLGASAEEADRALAVPAEPVSRLGPSGVDPLRVWAVIEKHAAEVRLVFLLDLLRVLGLRLVVREIGA